MDLNFYASLPKDPRSMTSERKGAFAHQMVKNTDGEISVDYPDIDTEGIDDQSVKILEDMVTLYRAS